MEFEFKHALHDLDQRTSPYFVGEIFCHGSLEMRRAAIETLREMDPARKGCQVLLEVLKLT